MFISNSRFAIERVLPLIALPPLTALALKYIWSTLTETQYGASVAGQCIAGAPYKLSYTGHAGVDDQLCILVAFFSHSLQPRSFPFTAHFALNIAPIAAFPFIEAARTGRPFLLNALFTTVMWIACQLFTGGVTLPLYWALFVAAGALRPGKVAAGYAQGTVFGFLVGFLLPTLAMLKYNDPYLTAFWQPFPVWVLLAQRAFVLLSPSTATVKGSKRTVQGLYTFIFLISAAGHVAHVWPLLGDMDALRKFFIPFVATPGQAIQDDEAAMNFLQWDGVFIFGSSILSSLWFARDSGEVLLLAIWNAAASVLLGPGAALAVVYAWREGRVAPE